MMVTPACSRVGTLFPVFPFLGLLLLSLLSGAVNAGQVQETNIPDELRQWVPWVLHEQEEKTCTLETTGATIRYCTWPSSLELDVDNNGATFTQEWFIETKSLVVLPGNSPFWPDKVQVNGKDILVSRHQGSPAVWLDPGKQRITGNFSWRELPDHLLVPPQTGLVRLTLLGKEVNELQLDEQGKLWFKNIARAKKDSEESLSVQVFRKIEDGVPLLQQLRILLIVSGSPREVTLGLVTGADFIPLQLHSPLPVRLDNKGRLQFQVRPGQWRIQLTLRNTAPLSPKRLSRGDIDGPWPEEEIWVFGADPKLRQVEIEGLFPVDPSRTSLPEDWKSFPAYLVKDDDRMILTEKNRGNPNPVPNRLQLKRKIWLDEQGTGLTVYDAITGTMTQGWRLNADPSQNLGKVEVEGNSRLITKLNGSDKIGVEVRQGSLTLNAESRIDKPVKAGRLVIPALGWDHTFQQLSAELNLPPGWKLFTASGVDKVSTWLNSWTLLDIFLVLIIGLATTRILGWGWGVVALFTLVLTYHQPGAPRFLWLPLLGLLALQKIVTAKTGERFSRIGGLILLVAIIVGSVPYMVGEIRTGLFPQLEYGPYHRVIRMDTATMPEARRTGLMGNEAMKQVADSMLKSKTQISGVERYSSRPVQRMPKTIQIDPQDIIQTGPGLPDWTWRKINLNWSGPVRPEQKVTFIFISPLLNTILAFVRVLLLALLIAGFLRQCLVKGKIIKPHAPSKEALALVFMLMLPGALITSPGTARAEVPRPEILLELQDRLLAPPKCGKNCANINDCLIRTDNDLLQVELHVDSLITGAVPLPGKNRLFDQILLDDRPAEILRLDEQGNSVVRLEPGRHKLLLKKDLKGRNELSFSFPLRPHQAQAILRDWSISGLRENGALDKQITLSRVTPAAIRKIKEQKDGSVHIPAFVQVERTLHMGLKWSVETRVIRRSPGTVIAMDIPLLPGERVTTDSLHIKDNSVKINMGPDQQVFSWHSALSPVDMLTFAAPENSFWTEVWFLDVSPIWHAETQGLPEINQINPAGNRYPEYRPYPGEALQLTVNRPRGVTGPTVTITKSRMQIKPGQRATEVTLSFSLTASRGLQHTITLPPDIDLQKTLINGKEFPLQLESNRLIIPVRPGKQDVEIGWRSQRGVGMKLVSESVDLGTESVNASIEVQVPSSRWILLAGGPRIGPAVLFWGELLVIILVALLLGRIRFTPLSTVHWLLLGLGLSQIPSPLAAVVVAWLLFLGLRKKSGGEVSRSAVFNLMQVLLVMITMAALGILFFAIQQGLLGHPDMQIGGNGSSGHLLRWYQDRNDVLLPVVRVYSVPLLAYRISMLLWALWLAVSLLKWLRWGWDCFTDTTAWKKTPRKEKATAEPGRKIFRSAKSEKRASTSGATPKKEAQAKPTPPPTGEH